MICLRACLVPFFGQVKLARWTVKKVTWAHLVGVVRLVLAAKSRVHIWPGGVLASAAILAKIAYLAGELCPIYQYLHFCWGVLFNCLSGQVDRLDRIFDDF